jgi:DNA-binding NtrC family response regulator
MMTNSPIPSQCLIVEDQALIAMSVEAYLEDAGFEVQTLASIAQAKAWLGSNAPEFVVLDFMLKDGAATELACALHQRGIPFIVYSGYSRHLGVPPELQEVPWLEKPTRREDLLKALVTLSIKDVTIAALNR